MTEPTAQAGSPGTDADPVVPPDWSLRDIACAAQLLGKGEKDQFDGPTLTDEEVVGLDGYEREQLVALPWLDSSPIDATVVAASAIRGLLARQLLVTADAMILADPENAEEYAERSLYADADLNGCLVLRRSANTFIALDRIVADQEHHLYYYLHDGGMALEEEVSSDGYHHFTVLHTADAAARAIVLVDQNEVASSDGDVIEIDAAVLTSPDASSPLTATLNDTRALTVVTRIDRESEPTQMTFYATSDSVFAMQADAPGDDATQMYFRQAARNTLLETLQRLLSD